MIFLFGVPLPNAIQRVNTTTTFAAELQRAPVRATAA
jgi:hypothetical protein